jgi:prolipoprotein diacylglyceryl transferase
VIWNVTPQILDFGKFEIRYYSILFALGFVLGYFILLKIFRKQGLTIELLDRLTIYMVISTIIGARVGHCLFYEFDYYINHPLEIILPWRGQLGEDFQFTGFQGLASHGAAIGIIIGIYLFSRKTKSAFLWTMDMIVIVTALAGACIRMGNLMNSEIYGKATGTTHGFVFTNDLSAILKQNYEGLIEDISYEKVDAKPYDHGVPLNIQIEFSRKVKDQQKVQQFGDFLLAENLIRYNFDNNVFVPQGDTIAYQIERGENKHLVLTAGIGGLPRYPTQIYEAASYLLIFVILLALFYILGKRLKNGYIFGVFLVLLFSARFLIEFIKENQENFEDAMALNMGQLLSIPFVVAGIVLIIWKWPLGKIES